MPLLRDKYEISEELLEELRSRFLDELKSNPEELAKYHPDDIEQVKYHDWYIGRYLVHQDLDVDDAFKMMKTSLQWRNEMEINTIKKEDFKEEFFEARMLQLYNNDKSDFPLMIVRVKVHDKNEEDCRLRKRFVLYWAEKAVRMNDWGGFTVLFDCTDIGYKNVDLDLIKFVLNLFNEYYPWTLNIFIIYNLPWYLIAIWKLVKTWIPEKHLNRVVFVDKESILEYVDEDKLPVCLGGTCTDLYEPPENEEQPKE